MSYFDKGSIHKAKSLKGRPEVHDRHLRHKIIGTVDYDETFMS